MKRFEVSIPYRYKQNLKILTFTLLKMEKSQSPIGTNKTQAELPQAPKVFNGLNPLQVQTKRRMDIRIFRWEGGSQSPIGTNKTAKTKETIKIIATSQSPIGTNKT